MLVGDHESDAILDFLHNCSQQLLDANIESTEESNPTTDDSRESSTQFSQLESIQDLIQFPEIMDTGIGRQSHKFDENQFKALSPISCDSDSGYDSTNSPQIASHNQMDEQMDDIHWKQTLSELFPDLI